MEFLRQQNSLKLWQASCLFAFNMVYMKLIARLVMDLLFFIYWGLCLHIFVSLNLMAIALRPGEIINLGEKEIPLIRLVQLGWLLENHIFCFPAYTLAVSWLLQFCEAANYWTLSHCKWRFTEERAPFSKILFPFLSFSISYLPKSIKEQPRLISL